MDINKEKKEEEKAQKEENNNIKENMGKKENSYF